MPPFENDDEDNYGQPREKSFLSKLGSFLFKAVTIVAVIALAIVALVTFSDTARDKLDEWTKDKDGKGGWGSKIRESLGLAKEETKKMMNTVSNGAETLWGKAKETLGIAPSPEDKGEGIATTIGATAAVGAGTVYGAKKLLGGKSHSLGTVDEHGNFNPATEKEVKAAQKLYKDQKDLKTLQNAAKDAEEKAASLRATEAEVRENLKKRGMLNPKKILDSRELKKAKDAITKLDKNIAELHGSIGVLEGKIAESTAKPLVTRESFNRAAADVESRIKPTTTIATAQPATNTPPSTNKPLQISAITAPTTTVVEGVSPPVPKAPTPPSGIWSSLKSSVGEFLRRHPIISKAVTPLSAAVIVTEGTSHAVDSWNSGKKEEAAATALKTTAEAGLAVVAPAPYMVVGILGAATEYTPDSVKNAVVGTIEGGRQAFLQRKLDNLPDDKKATIADWHRQADELGLKNISDIKIMTKLENEGWNSAPKTPANALATNKEQPMSPTKN